MGPPPVSPARHKWAAEGQAGQAAATVAWAGLGQVGAVKGVVQPLVSKATGLAVTGAAVSHGPGGRAAAPPPARRGRQLLPRGLRGRNKEGPLPSARPRPTKLGCGVTVTRLANDHQWEEAYGSSQGATNGHKFSVFQGWAKVAGLKQGLLSPLKAQGGFLCQPGLAQLGCLGKGQARAGWAGVVSFKVFSLSLGPSGINRGCHG